MINEQNAVEALAKNIKPQNQASIVKRTSSKLNKKGVLRAGAFLLVNVRLLVRMVKDSSFAIEWSTKALILGALVYFVIPTDATPDFIPIIGYLDDSLVITWVIKKLSTEIERYRHHTGE